MTRKRRSFTPEFKQKVASLVVDQGYTIAQASTSLGVGESVLWRWVQKLTDEREGITPKGKALTPEQRGSRRWKPAASGLSRRKTY